jgi:hypothetical protein
METIKEPMHPRRLEKNANITFKSALLPQAVFTWWESPELPLIIDGRVSIRSTGPRFALRGNRWITIGFCLIGQSSAVPIVRFHFQADLKEGRKINGEISNG